MAHAITATPLSLANGWRAAAASHRGHVRASNEDRFALVAEPPALILCDGMGGHAGGADAARIATDTLAGIYRAPGGLGGGAGLDPTALEAAIRRASARVARQAARDPARADMGTTLVTACFASEQIWVGHVGDSRAYRLTDRTLERLTTDHNPGADPTERWPAGEPVVSHVLTRVIGRPDRDQPDIRPVPMAGTQAIILCSDGVTDRNPDRALEAALRSCENLRQACEALIDLALAAGGHDNATVAVAMAPT